MEMNTINNNERLVLFDAVRKDKIFSALSGKISPKVFYKTQRALVKNLGESGISGTYLQDHLCRIIAAGDNVFARMAEKGSFEKLSQGMNISAIKSLLSDDELLALNLAARDISLIKPVYNFDFSSVIDDFDHCDISAEKAAASSPRQLIHEAMLQEESADAAIMLARYYRKYGCGDFSMASALIAEKKKLIPVYKTDPMTMDDIIGCESQKRALIENTKILLAGYSANNVLLYGDSGTGKSSSVKALLNLFAGEGLKLISIAKDKLSRLPEVFDRIEERGMKFIIFIDDLSFEENEYEFKAFKSIIEGRIRPKPKNAIFIVTTNRKNIVKNSWADREGQDDVRRRDNMEEKRSLSDRFGITLTYSTPNKKEYLEIVRSIAGKAGLQMDEDDLVSEALKWEIRHGGRSGRTARQFVDHMAGIRAASNKD